MMNNMNNEYVMISENNFYPLLILQLLYLNGDWHILSAL